MDLLKYKMQLTAEKKKKLKMYMNYMVCINCIVVALMLSIAIDKSTTHTVSIMIIEDALPKIEPAYYKEIFSMSRKLLELLMKVLCMFALETCIYGLLQLMKWGIINLCRLYLRK